MTQDSDEIPVQNEAAPNTAQAPTGAEVLALVLETGKAILDDERRNKWHELFSGLGLVISREDIEKIPLATAAAERADILAGIDFVPHPFSADQFINLDPYRKKLRESYSLASIEVPSVHREVSPIRDPRTYGVDRPARWRIAGSGKSAGSKLWKKTKKGRL